MSPHSGASAPKLAKPYVVPPPEPAKRRWSRAWLLLLIPVAMSYFWRTQASVRKPTALAVSTITAKPGIVRATVRVNGAFAALRSTTLTASRILGSRTGFNRGGDSNFSAPPGGGGGGGSDFNLVLLSLVKAGTRVRTGDKVAEFDSQRQAQRVDDYRDSVVQMENNLQSLTSSVAAAREVYDQNLRSADADRKKAALDLQTAPLLSPIDVEKDKLTLEQTEATYKALASETPLVQESQRAQVHAAELNLQQARIELQRAENNVRKMTIAAPMDGIVVMASIVL